MKTRKQLIDFEHKGNEKHSFKLRHTFLSLCMLTFIGGYSQTGQVNLNLKNATVKELFSEIEKQTSYRFSYRDAEINSKGKITISANGKELKAVLTDELTKQGLSYTVSGNKIIISPVKQTTVSTKENKVTGKVVDSKGEPVIGATIMEKGTTNGTITDFYGNFTLDVSNNAMLDISYIGYQAQSIKAISGQNLAVTLKEDTEILDEVVVVGFGSQKKVNLTGSVGIANAKELESRPVTSATQALQGLVPGLQISTNSGEMDKNMNINIRGTGTIGEGSSGAPLILIDGMEGDLNSINPQDIENISVLKDAAAASIYGSRAPFGVILVTTKSGKRGKMSINYNNSFRISSPINLPEMMDSYTFANFFNSASQNGGSGLTFSLETMQRMLDYQSGKDTNGVLASSNGQWGKPEYDPFTTAYANTDWYKELYKSNVFSQEHNVSFNGGNEKIAYYASFNFLDQNGLLRHGDDGFKRYNVTAKINAQITNWLKFNYNTRFTRRNFHKPTEYNDNLYEDIGRRTWPNLPIYDPNGYYFDCSAIGGTPATALALGGNSTSQTDLLYQQGALLIEPFKDWITHIELNYSTSRLNSKEVSLPVYNHDIKGNIINTNGTSSLYKEFQKDDYLNINIFSEYNNTFSENHNLKVMAGFQLEEKKESFDSVKKYGLLINNLPEFDLTTGTDGAGKVKTTEANGYSQEWATVGFFGRVNYDYKGKYLAELNMRYDGTSRFRRGNRWQLYPSLSLGWNISHENFWQPISNVVNTFKIRGSYGELGNQNTSIWYPTYRQMIIESFNGSWLQNGIKTNTTKVGDLVSNTLTWETIRTWNIGFDFGLFSNRLTGTFDYYTRFTDNMVGPAPELPLVLGIGTPKTNNCNLETRGWELSIGWKDRTNFGLGYNVRFMLSDAKTIIGSYPGNTTNTIDTYIKGREIGEIWGFETVGIAKTEEEMQQHIELVGGQDNLGVNWGAGDIMYANLDGKPGISEGARTINDHGDLKVIGIALQDIYLV